MNNRSGLTTFFLFLLLMGLIVLQILSMIQSDRLYERVNYLLETAQRSTGSGQTGRLQPRTQTMADEYPGDEGDWLIWSLPTDPATLNYIISKDLYANWVVGGNIFETLLKYDLDEVKLKPFLAESYEVSEDGLEITFRLRDDVTFSDGKKITTEDIIFSYETIKNPKVDAHALANYYRAVREITAIDKRTVKFTLSELYFKSLEIAGLMPILPKHIYQFTDAEEFNSRRSNPVGSGPYVFEKWDVGREIVLRRNEHYWGRRPKLDRIVFRVITNEVAALQALRSHQVDFLMPTSEQYAEVCGDKQFTDTFDCISYWDPTTGYSYIGWNQDRPFFKEKLIRQAMTLLVDRETINTHLLKGLGKVVSGPFYILGTQNDPNIKPWPYDPEKAKKLLDEAGWRDTDGDGVRDKDGVAFRFKFMIVSGSPVTERLAILLKDEFAKAGVDLIPDPYEWSVFEEKLNTREFAATSLAWGGVVENDPFQIWHSSQIQGRGSNRIGFDNPRADEIMEQARRTMDQKKRDELYHQFHRILHEEQPYTFLFTRPWLQLLDKRFENVIVHKLGLDPLEWYVPKEKQRYR